MASTQPSAEETLLPFKRLRKAGLRVEKGLRLFTKKIVTVRFEPPAQINNALLHLYRDVKIGRYSYLRSGTYRHVAEIGRYTSIGPNVILGEAEHPTTWLSTSPAVFFAGRFKFYPPEHDAVHRAVKRTAENTNPRSSERVTIGHDVWIGANVVVRRGVRIGNGAIIGTGAFVNKDVEPYSIVAGLPANKIGMRFDDETIARLQAIKWWEFDVSDLAGVDFSNPRKAIDQIHAAETSGAASRIETAYSRVEIAETGYRNLKVHPLDGKRAAQRLAARPAEQP